MEKNMSIKKFVYIIFMIIGIIGLSSSLIYMSKQSNKLTDELSDTDSALEKIIVYPPSGSISKPVKVELTEEELVEIPIYSDSQEE